MCIWYIQYQKFNQSLFDIIYIYIHNYNNINILYIYIPNTYKFLLILFTIYISIYKSILLSFGSPSEIIPLRALQVSSGERIVLDGERRRGERLHTMRVGTGESWAGVALDGLFWCFFVGI